MKQVTYTSKDIRIHFTWTAEEASIEYLGSVVQSWNDRRVPKLEQFERVAEKFLADYDAIIDRLLVKYPKNFFDNECRNLPPTEEPSK